MDNAAASPASPGSTASSRQPSKRACDQCKLRKIRCSLAQPCATCVARGFQCTFLKPQRKRGPVGKRLVQLQREQSRRQREDYAESPAQAALGQAGIAEEIGSPVPNVNPEWASQRDATEFIVSSLGDIASFDQNQDMEYWPPDRNTTDMTPSGSLFMDFALPPAIQLDAPEIAFNMAQPSTPNAAVYGMHGTQDGFSKASSLWPPYLSEATLIPWIDVYFHRLHPTIPVLNRSSLFTRMFLHEHRQNPLFGSMLLSLCAFAITQPIFISERPTSSSRERQAKQLMNEAIRMRSSFDFGENPTLETVLTSFFLFGCLFGSNQHNAAWLRLREAIDLAQTIGLNDPARLQSISVGDKGQGLRTYLVLFVTERAYAIQRRHSIHLKRIPGSTTVFSDHLINNSSHDLLSGMIVYDERDAASLLGLSLLAELFGAIADDAMDCWNATCSVTQGTCCKPGEAGIIKIHEKLARVSERGLYNGSDRLDLDDSTPTYRVGDLLTSSGSQYLLGQYADILVTQKWLQNRVWCLCLAHNLLKLHSSHTELRFSYAVSLAESTLELCQRLPLSAMEAHGIGLIEKLYDIAATAVTILFNPAFSAEASGSASLKGSASGQNLSDKFLKVFKVLRGGNHPYLERYLAHLNSMSATAVYPEPDYR